MIKDSLTMSTTVTSDGLTFHKRSMTSCFRFTVVVMTFSLLYMGSTTGDNLVGVRMVLGALVFLVMAGVFLIKASVEKAELSTREKMLELERRLAEMQEQLSKR